MTQDSVGAGAEHCGHPTAPTALAEVADAIDPTLDPAQQAPRDAVPDGPSSHPKLQKLPAINHPVLSLGKVPDATVQQTRRTLCMPDVHNVGLDSHGTDPG
jgi:hypothetical protein